MNRTGPRAKSASAAFRALFGLMSGRRRWHLFALLCLMAVGAVAEMVTIGAVLPFLTLMTNPAGAGSVPGVGPLVRLLGDDPLLGASLLLAGCAVGAALLRVLLTWFTQSFVQGLGHEIAQAIFGRMLRQPYSRYLGRNSSEWLSGIEAVQLLVFRVLQPLMMGVAATVIAGAIAILLFLISPLPAFVAAAAAAAVYLAIGLATRRRLRGNSTIFARAAAERIKTVQEGLGGIRDILLEGSQDLFEERFRRADHDYRRTQAMNQFFAVAPRYVVEAAGIAAIVLVALLMSQRPGGIVAAIPVLGALALGAQRLLPLLQQAYLGWSSVAGHLQPLIDVAALVEEPISSQAPRRAANPAFPFATDIVLDGVGFSYDGRAPALSGVSLRIAKGARVGIAGRTGSGKSSLLDLLMGLLAPSGGEIRIDGRRLDDSTNADWQAQLAHVPQTLYLTDASIAANIAFGEAAERIDMGRVRAAARTAQVETFIESLPHGYDTPVGERGVRLSGGERQRLGIARALYKRSAVLILDEATSALDDETEQAVLAAIAALREDVTVIMIAHRLSTLSRCDLIVRLDDGRIAATGSYRDVFGSPAQGRRQAS